MRAVSYTHLVLVRRLRFRPGHGVRRGVLELRFLKFHVLPGEFHALHVLVVQVHGRRPAGGGAVARGGCLLYTSLALALAAYVAFGLLVGSGTVLLANYGDTALDETSAQLAALPSADADAIDAAVPSAYRWAPVSYTHLAPVRNAAWALCSSSTSTTSKA